MSSLEHLIHRAEQLLARFEQILPVVQPPVDWAGATAFRWRLSNGRGYLQPIAHPHQISLSDLKNIDEQKALVEQNTRQFVAGKPANNVLLTGARGTGKSSIVKALLNEFSDRGLRLIEVEKSHLNDLPDIVDMISARPERFIIFCDDLSFEDGDAGYKALKVVLDGSIQISSENVLIYATSNRRHLLPEYMAENLQTQRSGTEIHPGEAVEEKISLSERFGLWVSFYAFDQEQYLEAVRQWLGHFGIRKWTPALERAALLWSLSRGMRSGRVAWQFARDWAGRKA